MNHVGIFCLESLWSKSTDSKRASVAPLVEFVARGFGARHTTFTCGTAEELSLRLTKSRKGGYGILYLAGHGECGRFMVEGAEITLGQIADMMGERFGGWAVHFGSCSMLNISIKEAKAFRRKVGAARLSGYRKPVDWSESSALDLLWLCHLVSGEKFDWEANAKLINKLGFVRL